MAKWTNRTCECGKIQFTASRSAVCSDCVVLKKKQQKIEREIAHLKSIYGNVSGPTINEFGKRCYTFTHSCGTSQTWRYDNLLKQIKSRPDDIPCRECGGKERVKKALAGYVAKFNLSERARSDLHAYTRKVRGLSEKTYRDNIDILNPQRLPRMLGNQGYHLDHKVPIVECFKRGWVPEQAAAVENLQLLEAGKNLSKGRFVPSSSKKDSIA